MPLPSWCLDDWLSNDFNWHRLTGSFTFWQLAQSLLVLEWLERNSWCIVTSDHSALWLANARKLGCESSASRKLSMFLVLGRLIVVDICAHLVWCSYWLCSSDTNSQPTQPAAAPGVCTVDHRSICRHHFRLIMYNVAWCRHDEHGFQEMGMRVAHRGFTPDPTQSWSTYQDLPAKSISSKHFYDSYLPRGRP